MKLRDKLTLLNVDCMEYMATVPDKYFDLAVVDPEYGINVNHNMGRRKGDKKSSYKKAYWDKESVSKRVLDEIIRISTDQIIWGANHFISKIPYDSPCWIMWDKGFSEDVTFAQFELAWTSFKTTCKKYDFNAAANKNRIHPTQKPVKLYEWIYANYATENCKVIDTHLGSGSNAVAAHYSPLVSEFVGCELDEEYYNAMIKRVRKDTEQLKLF